MSPSAEDPTPRPRRDPAVAARRRRAPDRPAAHPGRPGAGGQGAARDIDRIADGGSAIRFVIGEYGSGKTFFLHLVRSIALEKKLVTTHADLTPDRRLHATGGQARALYAELMRNLATAHKPDGGALASVVERFVTTALAEAEQSGRRRRRP